MAAPYRIVVGHDFSELAAQALAQAVSLAQRNPEAELHVVAVVDKEASEIVPVEDRHASLVKITDNMRERLIAELKRVIGTDGKSRIPTIAHVRVGAIAEQIAALAGELGAELVVVGTHGRRGLRHLLLGSVAERTVRLAPCPVLVVRPKNTHFMDNVPAIEPPCPECLKAREESKGARWWCEPHQAKPPEIHAYSYSGRLDEPPVPAPYC